MEDTKHCPFCGHVAFPPAKPPSEYLGLTICTYCGAQAPDYLWQKRPLEDELNSHLCELQQAMERAEDLLQSGQINYASYVLTEKLGKVRWFIKTGRWEEM